MKVKVWREGNERGVDFVTNGRQANEQVIIDISDDLVKALADADYDAVKEWIDDTLLQNLDTNGNEYL